MTATEQRTPSDRPKKEVVRLRRRLEGIIGVPATEGNRLDVLRNGDEIFPAMLKSIDSAKHTIDFLTFVYWKGDIGVEFAQHLAARARDGVRVRVLLDSYGAKSMEHSTLELMKHAGAKVHWFRPIHRFHPGQINHRTHRKVLIVDEATAFTGGVGIADVWRGNASAPNEWRDTHFQLEGPAVDGLRAAFLDNWAETDPEFFNDDIDRFPEQPKPGHAIAQCVRGAAENGWSDIATLFRALLQLAEHRIRITTAYFVPDEELMERLCEASKRGVRIEILLPGPYADKRFVQIAAEADYERLLDAGIRIWNFQPSMLHAKVMTVDGQLANIGSANLNSRSTMLDEEISLVVLDETLVAKLDSQFDEDLERSCEIELGQWSHRSLFERLLEQTSRVFRRWF
jgi:cardiolipin synthase